MPGSAPGWAAVSGLDARVEGVHLEDASSWTELLPRTRLQPDTRHVFPVGGPGGARGTALTHVRLDVYPDGGMSRFRVHGDLDAAALSALTDRWRAADPVS